MKIVITGANGMLGHDLWKILSGNHDAFAVDITKPDYIEDDKKWRKLDITVSTEVYETITRINPDVVVHAAALTDVDGCEKNPDKAYKINAVGTRNVAVACQRFDAGLVYLSTDYVFNGQSRLPYREDDRTDPINVYGASKLAGEELVKTLINRYYIVRTAWLFGSGRNNFMSRIIERARQNEEIPIVPEMTGSPTYSKDLAGAISDLIAKPLYGTYHITNDNGCSRLELVDWMRQYLGIKNPVKIRKLSLEKLDLPAKRPLYSRLDNMFWELSGFKRLRPWQDAVREFCKELKN